MILEAASVVYGGLAAWRRRWYLAHPSRRRRLTRPVVSIGNLAVGGSGKTPTVEYVARQLLRSGERPAILSRGYRRTQAPAGDDVTVVSDGTTIRASLALAGDEPLMLARALPGVRVLVGSSRYAAGRLAEEQLDATIHILDDGFQHLALSRDVDLVLVSEDDLDDRPMPAGRLRERLATASQADAVLTTATGDARERLRRALGVSELFSIARHLSPPRWLNKSAYTPLPPGARVVAVAGIARPWRFVRDLESSRWTVAEQVLFRDHHRFAAADLERIGRAFTSSGAMAVLTTEKDAVRLEQLDLGDLPVAALPLTVTIEPAASFEGWLMTRLSR